MTEIEEEIFVYAEFDESVNLESYKTVHVLGLDKEKPIIQIDDNFFTGSYQHPVGTYMIFEEGTPPKCMDELFDKVPEKYLDYVGKTRKYIKMKRTYVSHKNESGPNIINKLQQPEIQLENPTFTSLQDAVEKFKDKWTPKTVPPLTADSIDIIKNELSEDSNSYTAMDIE